MNVQKTGVTICTATSTGKAVYIRRYYRYRNFPEHARIHSGCLAGIGVLFHQPAVRSGYRDRVVFLRKNPDPALCRHEIFNYQAPENYITVPYP